MKNKTKDNIIVNQINKKWTGGLFPAIYDFSMDNKVIPKKMNASVALHNMIIKNELSEASGRILELATGTGNISGLINNNLDYTGIDVSLGLLKLAEKKFKAKGFADFVLYKCAAEELPFKDNEFDCCVSNLSLNFFSDIKKALCEASRVLKSGGLFFGSVPVPERNSAGNMIRGTLYNEKDLTKLFTVAGFSFKTIDVENGAVLYFRAVK